MTSHNKTAELTTVVMLVTFIVVRNVLLECTFLAQCLARCMLTVLGGVGEDMFFLPMQEHNYFVRSLVVCNNLNGDYKKLIIPMNCIIYD